MLKYIVKRVLYAILTIFIVASLTFALMMLVPGGPFLAEKSPSAATIAALNEKYGLDQPKIVQYKNYMVKLAQGDLGMSLKQRGKTVNAILGERFPVSAKIGGIAILIAICIGIPMGALAALNRGKAFDNVTLVIATFGISVPSFVISTVFLIFFGVTLGILPTYGLATAKHYIMPIVALSFYPSSYLTRLMRTSMLDVLGQDYMRTARSKGLSQTVMLFKHALRNAVLPAITYMGPLLAYTLVGSFIIERIFTIPGLGSSFISSILNRDYPLIMGTTIFLAFLLIFMNVIVDVLYKVVDPRIKLN